MNVKVLSLVAMTMGLLLQVDTPVGVQGLPPRSTGPAPSSHGNATEQLVQMNGVKQPDKDIPDNFG